MSYAGRRVLVTGGLGFIGSNLALRLVQLGADVTIADALVPTHGGNRFNVDPVVDDVRVVVTDLHEPVDTAELVAGNEVVFSLAGQVSHVDSMSEPLQDLESNYRSTLVVLEACRHAAPSARVVFAGSRQQYGRARTLPVAENHSLEPVDINGIDKVAAEAAVLLYNRVHELETCSLRLTNTYGPRMQMRHDRQGFAQWFFRLALDGREIELFDGGSALRDFNYVDDVVDALLLVGERDEAVGEAFNLGHPEPVSIRDFAATLIDAAGSGSLRSVPFTAERARIDVGSVYCDFGKLRAAVGWEPHVGLRDGIERTIEYYRAHRDRYW